MGSDSGDYHKFNNDLLLDDESERQARLFYEEIFVQLNDEFLKDKFRPIDKRANRRKRIAHLSGSIAILLAATSLLATAFSPIIHSYANKSLEYVIVILAVFAGIAAAMLGCSGVLYGKAKRNWLHERLKTEKLRQLHFQRFVFNCSDTCKLLKGDVTVEAYCEQRDLWTDQVVQRLSDVADSEIAKIIEIESDIEPWLTKDISQNIVEAEKTAINCLRKKLNKEERRKYFDAYLNLRIKHQADYAFHKISEHGEILSKLSLLKNISLFSFGLAIFLHVLVLIAIFRTPKMLSSLHSGVLASFIVAAGAEKLIEGLALENSHIRYKEYAAKMNSLLVRYERAYREDRTTELVGIIIETERAAFEEMRGFIRTHHESAFVM